HRRRTARVAHRHRARLAGDLRARGQATRAAAATSILAQHRLAEAQSLVRNGFAAFPESGNPPWHRRRGSQRVALKSACRENFVLVLRCNKARMRESFPPESSFMDRLDR